MYIRWKVNGSLYDNKIAALGAAGGNKYNIEVVTSFSALESSYDWTKEPEEDYEQLILENLLRLRDSYDYLVLLYSGGSDSHTILHYCLKFNILLDEIVVMRFSTTNKDHSFSDAETTKYAIPFLHSIQNSLPKTKITILNTTWKDYEKAFNDNTWEKNHGQLTLRYTLRTNSWDANRTGLLTGELEPKVTYSNGEWFGISYDSENYTAFSHIPNIIYFFTSIEHPKLHAKQLHLVKNYLKNNNITTLATNTVEYKRIARLTTRAPLLIPEAAEFRKADRLPSGINDLKSTIMLKEGSPDLRKAYRGYVEQKINGKSLWRLFSGIPVVTLNLGK